MNLDGGLRGSPRKQPSLCLVSEMLFERAFGIASSRVQGCGWGRDEVLISQYWGSLGVNSTVGKIAEALWTVVTLRVQTSGSRKDCSRDEVMVGNSPSASQRNQSEQKNEYCVWKTQASQLRKCPQDKTLATVAIKEMQERKLVLT